MFFKPKNSCNSVVLFENNKSSCWWIFAALRLSPWQQSLLKAMAAVFLSHSASLKTIHRRMPPTNFMSPVRTWKTPSNLLPPGSIHRWHISEGSLNSVHLDVKLHRTLTLRDALTQKLFIHLLLSLAEIFSASFAINVLQTASPCLWVLLFSDTLSLH